MVNFQLNTQFFRPMYNFLRNIQMVPQLKESVQIHIVSSLSFSGIKVIKKVNNQNHIGKDLSKKNSLEVFVVSISSVVEFQRWWILKSKLFGQDSTCHQGKIFRKFLQVMTFCQKVPKLYFQSQFWMSKINQIFSKKNFT